MTYDPEVDPKPKLCPNCNKRKASSRRSKLCIVCHKQSLAGTLGSIPSSSVIPPDLLARATLAKTTQDWQKLAAELAPTMSAILSGETKATSAQASLMKDIMNRAFGRPVATQTESKVAAGVIILPTLVDEKSQLLICPRCGFNATKDTLETKEVVNG